MKSRRKKILVLSLQKKSLSIYGQNVLTSFNSDEYDIYFSADSETQYQGKNAYPLRSYHSKIQFLILTAFYMPFSILISLRKFSRNYHTLFAPTDGLWNIFFVLAFLLLRKNIVITVHDARRHLGIENILLTKLTNFIRRRAHHLIFLTKDQQNILYEDLGLTQPYSIIPLGLFELSGVKPKSRHTTKNILFTGRIAKYKGVDILLEAAENIEEKYDKLVVAGEQLTEIKNTTSSKIEIIDDFISNDQLVKLLNQTDLMVLPYLEASQSGVLTLGINSEIPMICSRVNGLAEQLTEDECIFVPPGDATALADAITLIFSNTQKYYSIKEALKDKKNKMSWENISLEFLAILRAYN